MDPSDEDHGLELINPVSPAGYFANSLTYLVRFRSPFLSGLTFIPFRLQPPQSHFVTVDLARYFIAATVRVYPPGRPIRSVGHSVARIRVRQVTGGSPTGLAESSSLALRTGTSPQVALHLSSRKRSYHCRIQGGNVTLTRTFTRLIRPLQRRTASPVSGGFAHNTTPTTKKSLPKKTNSPMKPKTNNRPLQPRPPGDWRPTVRRQSLAALP